MRTAGILLIGIMLLGAVVTPLALAKAQEEGQSNTAVETLEVLLENMIPGLQRAIEVLQANNASQTAITALQRALEHATKALEELREGNSASAIAMFNMAVLRARNGIGEVMRSMLQNATLRMEVKEEMFRIRVEESLRRTYEFAEQLRAMIGSLDNATLKQELEERLETAIAQLEDVNTTDVTQAMITIRNVQLLLKEIGKKLYNNDEMMMKVRQRLEQRLMALEEGGIGKGLGRKIMHGMKVALQAGNLGMALRKLARLRALLPQNATAPALVKAKLELVTEKMLKELKEDLRRVLNEVGSIKSVRVQQLVMNLINSIQELLQKAEGNMAEGNYGQALAQLMRAKAYMQEIRMLLRGLGWMKH
jgi:tetratricopeptide (TPR) repeat protein